MISGGKGSGARGFATISNGVVTGVTVISAGSGYATEPAVEFGNPMVAPPHEPTMIERLRAALINALLDIPAAESNIEGRDRLHLARMAWEIRDQLPPELATYAALLGGTEKSNGTP